MFNCNDSTTRYYRINIIVQGRSNFQYCSMIKAHYNSSLTKWGKNRVNLFVLYIVLKERMWF